MLQHVPVGDISIRETKPLFREAKAYEFLISPKGGMLPKTIWAPKDAPFARIRLKNRGKQLVQDLPQGRVLIAQCAIIDFWPSDNRKTANGTMAGKSFYKSNEYDRGWLPHSRLATRIGCT